MTKKAILFLGLPGSGKTTQSVRIAEAFDFLHLTTSRIIRDRFRNTPIGRDLKIDQERVRYDAGKIIDPELVSCWVNETVRRMFFSASGIVLDGSPRSREEAENLFPTLSALFGVRNILPLYLKIVPETAFDRISSRFVCIRCEKTYSKINYLESVRCRDDSCSGILSQKLLDKPEIFDERLRMFQEKTKGAIDFFHSKRMLHTVNGEREIDYVFRDIVKLLGARTNANIRSATS